MEKPLLLEIISNCEKVGVQIYGVVFDMGNHNFMSKFRLLRDGLNYFPNPVDSSRSVYLFLDPPHLLKLLRNHCLDKGFTLDDENGVPVPLGKSEFYQILLKDGPELKLCPKLTMVHIQAKGSTRQRVRLASQLFSETVAQAFIYHFGEAGRAQSNFINIVNQWFDTINIGIPIDSVPHRCGFGLRLESQLEALHAIKKTVECLKFSAVVVKKSKLPFQKVILIGIKSLRSLYEDLAKRGITYILTSRLNQDCLENFFSTLRCIGKLSSLCHL